MLSIERYTELPELRLVLGDGDVPRWKKVQSEKKGKHKNHSILRVPVDGWIILYRCAPSSHS